MKRFSVFVFALALTGSIGAQTTTPQAVAQAFQKKFPTVTAVQWEEEEDGIFEADFKLNGIKMSAAFEAEGQWVGTETAIKIKDLPEAVRQAIAHDFPDYEVEEAEKLETPAGIAFEVKLEKDDDGEEAVVEALYAADGKLLQQEQEGEEDGEEEEEDGDHD